MIRTFYEKNGIVYQVLVPIENRQIVVDLCYSGNTDEKELIEFEFASVSDDNNLSEETYDAYNKILECGLEEKIVYFLADHYKGTSITFDPNHYQLN